MSLHLVVGGQKFKNPKYKIQKTALIHDIPSNLGVRNSKIQKNPIVYDSRYGFGGQKFKKSKFKIQKTGWIDDMPLNLGLRNKKNKIQKFKSPRGCITRVANKRGVIMDTC